MSEVVDNTVNNQRKDNEGTSNTNKRSKSKDVLAGVEARLTRLELAVADGKDQFEDANASIEDLKGKMLGALNEVVATQRQERDEFQTRVLEVLESMKAQVEEMRGDWPCGSGLWPMGPRPCGRHQG